MVTDIFGKVKYGTVVGDNLGTAVAPRTASAPSSTVASATSRA
jgi:hypothetical protein